MTDTERAALLHAADLLTETANIGDRPGYFPVANYVWRNDLRVTAAKLREMAGE